MLHVEETQAYASWFSKIRDSKAKVSIVSRVDRIAFHESLLGDFKAVGEGVMELRFDLGPGYRVYVSIQNRRLLLLLMGGDKSRQTSDIEKARELLRQWRAEHEAGNINLGPR